MTTNPPTATTATTTKVENLPQAISLIESTNINEVIRGLNFLLQKSYDANEITSSNNVIYLEQYPYLLTALGNLLDVINPSGKLPFENLLKNQEQNYYSFLFGDTKGATNHGIEWSIDLPGVDSVYFKFLSAHLDSNPLITTIISILRNLSFEIANEVYLAYHSTIIRQVASIMISSILSPKLNENLQLIFEFLMNIGHKLEFNGKKRIQLSSNGFLDEHYHSNQQSQYHHLNTLQHAVATKQAKELLKFKMSYEMSHQSTVEYTISVKALLSIINAFISKEYYVNRYYLVKSLELLLKLTSNSENESFFINTPLVFLENLIYLFAVSNSNLTESNIYSSIIPENYIIIGDPYGKTRPLVALSTPTIQPISSNGGQAQSSGQYFNSGAMSSNYAGSSALMVPTTVANSVDNRVYVPNTMLQDQVDVELRDLVIDALHYFCRISVSNRQRIASIPYALRLIFKFASFPLQNLNYYNNIKRSFAGNGNGPNVLNVNPVKSEAHSKAAYLFALFGTVPEALPIFRSLKNELLLLACSDDIFADLVLNKLGMLATSQNETSENSFAAMETMNIN